MLAGVVPLDLFAGLFVVLFFIGLTLVYGIALALRGHRQYARLDKQGSSVLLNKTFMEMGYWSLQGLTRWLAKRGVTPDQLTWAALILGVLSGIAVANGDFGVAALTLFLAGFLDLLDGLVARLNGTGSDAGEVLDATIDRYVDIFFFGGLVIYYRQSLWLTILALAAMAGGEMVTYSSAKSEALQVSIPSAMMRRHERVTYLVIGACLSAITIPWLEQHWQMTPRPGIVMVIVLLMIAVLGNIAAVRRMRWIAVAVRKREQNA